jgi:signal transduction histidine kinase
LLLAATLLAAVALGAVGAVSAYEAHALAGMGAALVLSLVCIVLLLTATRLLLAQTLLQQRQQAAVEQCTRELESLVEARSWEASALATHLQEFAEREKSELARHLHDELGGLLTAAKMDLSWLQSRLEMPALQERLIQLGGVLDEAMDLKRQVVEDLRPSLLEHFGLPTALRAYLESACGGTGIRAEITMIEETRGLPKEASIALFRVMQEGVANILRHAHAHVIRLQLTDDGRALAFTLSDDGCGFDPATSRSGGSYGLAGMRQRVRALGGELAIESRVGMGTTLRVQIPAEPGAVARPLAR